MYIYIMLNAYTILKKNSFTINNKFSPPQTCTESKFESSKKSNE